MKNLKIYSFIALLLIIVACGPVKKTTASEAVNVSSSAVSSEAVVSKITSSESSSRATEKISVLIFPLENHTDKNKFVNSGVIQPVIYKSLRYFIGIVPSLEVLEVVTDSGLTVDSIGLSRLAENNHADLIIYGDYSFTNNRQNPDAMIEAHIWSKVMEKDIFVKKYKTPTDAEIFDTIDTMILDHVQTIMNTTNIRYSRIAFKNFRNREGEILNILER